MIAKVQQTSIGIPEQFNLASEPGYLARHIELTAKLKSLIERPDIGQDTGFAQRGEEARKDELFDQACEDTARSILLAEETITSVSVKDAQNMVKQRYNNFLNNPAKAGASRAAAVH